jgi:uncharacterized membrane protein YhaH (DUF805 family)
LTFTTVYKRAFDFEGRSDRPEYWWFILQFICALMVAALVDVIALAALGWGYVGPGLLYGLLILSSVIPSLAVQVRRLHDQDRSGWWLLISLIPFVGGIVLLVFMCLPGTPGPNRFGPSTTTPLVGAAPGAPYAPTAEPPPSAPSTTNLEKLEQLGRLRDQGVLTQEEFDAQKALLLKP